MFFVEKRRSPFGSSPPEQSKIPNARRDTPFDRTKKALFTGATRYYKEEKQWTWKLSGEESKTDSIRCHVCVSPCSEPIPCAHCKKVTCESCARQCEKCQDVFCSFCSTINYSQRFDRIFCFPCEGEEERIRRGGTWAPSGPTEGGGWGEGFSFTPSEGKEGGNNADEDMD